MPYLSKLLSFEDAAALEAALHTGGWKDDDIRSLCHGNLLPLVKEFLFGRISELNVERFGEIKLEDAFTKAVCVGELNSACGVWTRVLNAFKEDRFGGPIHTLGELAARDDGFVNVGRLGEKLIADVLARYGLYRGMLAAERYREAREG